MITWFILYDLNKIIWGFKASISSHLQRSCVEESKIERVYLRSLIWIPLIGSKEKMPMYPYCHIYLDYSNWIDG